MKIHNQNNIRKMVGCLVWLGSLHAGYAQVAVVYDNQITNINNGRVNDANFPAPLLHADNFAIPVNSVINQVAWYGAYKDGNLLPDGDDDFTLGFYNFQNGTPAIAPFATFRVGAVTRSVTAGSLINGNPVFAYSANIGDFQIPAGDYLLSILNNPNDDDLWLWGASEDGPGRSFLKIAEDSPWMEFSGDGVIEYSYTLSYVPEVSVAALLIFAGFLPAVVRRRPGKKESQFT
jgi:hypothetical protein